MPTASCELAVLFADVSGSTRLYETLGDERALATVGNASRSCARLATAMRVASSRRSATTTLTVKGKLRDVSVCELLWQDSNDDLTTLSTRVTVPPARLCVRHGSREIVLGEWQATLALGRDAQNDIVIGDKMASRMHAHIERRRDRFVLIDHSSNGTFLTFEGEPEIPLRREEFVLRGRGRISFGHAHATAPGETVDFACSG
ncbi:MAG: FHA domain-containing protein [Pseudomonadota bacterium]|nr:FHA domain-containing protein [Pseudomonadota bacterium]